MALIFIGYILCDASVVAYSLTAEYSGDNEVLRLLDAAIDITYSYLLPLVFFSTMERLMATCMVKKYENVRPWGFVVASQFFCLAFVGCSNILLNDDFGGRFRNYIIIAAEICIYIVVTFLLLINQRRTRLRVYYDYTKLSCRYQLAENIRSCRFLLTFVLFDSLVTVTDLVADVGFNFENDFNPDRCVDSNYLPTFLTLKIISIVFELAIPCALPTVGHESYRNRLKLMLCLRSSQAASVNAECRRNHIRNVLGEQVLTGHTTDQYFSRLSNSWDAIAPMRKY